MQITKKQLSSAEIEFTIEVSPEEMQPQLEKAAIELTREKSIAGFRPGKAPFDMVKRELGEMPIYEAALNDILSKSLYEAMNQELHGAEVTGQPQINIEKMAPGNALVYKAVVTLVPEITLGDWRQIKLTKKEVKVDEKEVEKYLANLQQVYAKEEPKDGALALGDKVIVGFEVFVDKVAIEGGSHPEYELVLGEGRFIPGFEEQLVGLKKSDKKEFELRFPADYHQKNLANKLANFKIEIKDTLSRTLPELNDDFAKTIGEYKNLDEIKTGVTENLHQEAIHKEDQRQEIALLDELIKIASFSEIPNSLIHSEAHRMVGELSHSLEEQGLKFEDYLTHLKKTEETLSHELEPDATRRLKTALISRQVAKEQSLFATKEEVEAEIENLKKLYGDNPEVMNNIISPGYHSYLNNMLTNRKVIEYLKKEILK